MNKYIKTFETFKTSRFDFEIPTEEYIDKVLDTMNIPSTKFKLLGEGAYGFALDLGDSILKITTDKNEVYYAEKLMNIESKNLVKVYQVVEIKSKYQYAKIYAIHQEKLITEFDDRIKNMVWYLSKHNPVTPALLANSLTNDIILDFFRSKFIGWTDDMILHCFDMIKQMYLEAQKYNLPTDEIHCNNVGIRKDTKDLVYFDISSPYESHEINIPIIQI